MLDMTRQSEFLKRPDIFLCYEIFLGVQKHTFSHIPTVRNQKKKMSRTRGETKESVEEEEEEVVVDDGDNEIPDDEGESDAARDVKNQNEEDNFV